MRFHIPAIPGQQTVKDNSVCAYTQKITKFADMMVPRGHEVFVYSGPESYDGFTKHFNAYEDAEYKGFNIPDWLPHNAKAAKLIKENWQDGDFLLLIAGLAQASIASEIDNFRTVEFGIGYQGVFADFKVFESYAWMHTVYGENQGAYDANGEWYSTVIPNYFDTKDFDFVEKPDDYYLFIGRIIERKGLEVVSQVCERLGKKLILAGGGDYKVLSPYGEYVGNVDPKERNVLMGNATATFVPSLYLEPFGGVTIESMLTGTPVITTDWGAFSENVKDYHSGFRCKTFGDFLYATEAVKDLDRKSVRDYAIDNFSLEAVGPMYERFFNQVDDLQDKGWYDERSRKFEPLTQAPSSKA